MRSFPDSVRFCIAIGLFMVCDRLVTGNLRSSYLTPSEEAEGKTDLDVILNYALNITDRQNFVFNSSFSSSSTFCFSPTGEKGKCKPLSLCPVYHSIVKQLKTSTVATFFRERICRLLHTSILICCPFGKPGLPIESNSPESLPVPLPQQQSQPQLTQEEPQNQTETNPQLSIQTHLQNEVRSQLKLQEESEPQTGMKEQVGAELLVQGMPQRQQYTEQEFQPRFQYHYPPQINSHPQQQLLNPLHPRKQNQAAMQSLPQTDLLSNHLSHPQSVHQPDSGLNQQLISNSITETDAELTETAENMEMPESFSWLRWSTRLLEMFLLICLIAFLIACLFISLFFLFFRDLFLLLASAPQVPDELPIKK